MDFTEGIDVASCPAVSVTPTKILPADNLEQGIERMAADGYIPIGYTAFPRSPANKHSLATHAKEMKASVVLLYSKYAGSVYVNKWVGVAPNWEQLAVYWVKTTAPIGTIAGCENLTANIRENLRLISNSGVSW